MFTLLEKFGSFFLNALKTIQEQEDRHRRREFGEILITCYLRLIEVISKGREIIGELDSFISTHDRYPSRPDYLNQYHRNVGMLLLQQTINLRRLLVEFSKIQRELRILAPDMAAQMERKMAGKLRDIGDLARVNSLIGRLSQKELPTQFVFDEDREKEGWAGEVRYITIETPVNSFATEEPWGVEMYKRINEYFAVDEPHKRIIALESYADELRGIITSQFKLEEILWSAKNFRDGLHWR